MKAISTLIFIGLTHLAAAQLPEDAWLYGTWVNQGYEFQGSFYPKNSWNAEKLTLNEDYSLLKTNARIEDHEVKTFNVGGKWTYDAKSKKIQVYSDVERFSNQGKVNIVEREYTLSFSSKNYFTVVEMQGNHLVKTRFQREGSSETFEESVQRENARLADLALRYDTNSRVFYRVNSLDLSKRKTMYFDDNLFDFSLSTYDKSPDIEWQKTRFTGKIKDFTDSTIVVSMNSESVSTAYVSGMESTVESDYSFNSKGWIVREVRLTDIDGIYSAELNFAKSLAPITFSVSAITALLVAPLISINYKTGDFNKERYYKTAGIGLIGVGASIPLAIIFNNKKPMRFISMGEKEAKNNWYLQKAPR